MHNHYKNKICFIICKMYKGMWLGDTDWQGDQSMSQNTTEYDYCYRPWKSMSLIKCKTEPTFNEELGLDLEILCSEFYLTCFSQFYIS